jgi:hypothetical protein
VPLGEGQMLLPHRALDGRCFHWIGETRTPSTPGVGGSPGLKLGGPNEAQVNPAAR